MVKMTPFQRALKHSLQKSKKFNQNGLASHIGITQPQISRIISGDQQGKTKTREAIAEAFGYTLEQFLKLGRELAEGNRTVIEHLPPIEIENIMTENFTEDAKKIIPNLVKYVRVINQAVDMEDTNMILSAFRGLVAKAEELDKRQKKGENVFASLYKKNNN